MRLFHLPEGVNHCNLQLYLCQEPLIGHFSKLQNSLFLLPLDLRWRTILFIYFYDHCVAVIIGMMFYDHCVVIIVGMMIHGCWCLQVTENSGS